LKKFLLALALVCAATSASAQKSGAVFGIEIGKGGEIVLPGTNSNLHEGDSMAMKIGYEQALSDLLSVRATIAYAGRQDSRLEDRTSEFPLNLLGFVTFGKHKVGLGATYHTQRDLDATFVSGTKVSYRAENAVGAKAEYNYVFDNRLYLGAFYEHVKYNYKDRKSNDGFGLPDQKYDGASLGVTLGYLF
jgi:hypothetical protein